MLHDIRYKFGRNVACPHCHARRGWRPLVNLAGHPSHEFGTCFACGTSCMPGAESIADYTAAATPYDPARTASPTRSSGRPARPNRPSAPAARPMRQVVPMSTDERASVTIAETMCPLVTFLHTEFDIRTHCRAAGVVTVASVAGRAYRDLTGFEYRTVDGEPVVYKLVRYGHDGHRLPGAVWTYPADRALPLFGIDQLHRSADVVLVESEKTAVVCSYTMPEFIWLAAGGARSLTTADALHRAVPLAGRRVLVLYDGDKAGDECTGPTVDVLQHAGCTVVSASAAAALRRHLFGSGTSMDIADVVLPPEPVRQVAAC